MKSNIPDHAELVFKGVIFDIYQWQQELYDGTFTTFEALSRPNAVSIIPVIGDKLVIQHEEQPGKDPFISFPGGHIEPGETPLQAAIRELREESGLTFKELKLVAVEDIGGHKMDWWAYRYVATGLSERGYQELDAGEKIRTQEVDFETAKQLADGNIYMSMTVMDNVHGLDDLLSLPECHNID